MRRRIANGERVPGADARSSARAADKLITAEKRAGEAELLSALGGGISRVFEAALGAGSERALLPAAFEVIDVLDDVEAVEVVE